MPKHRGQLADEQFPCSRRTPSEPTKPSCSTSICLCNRSRSTFRRAFPAVIVDPSATLSPLFGRGGRANNGNFARAYSLALRTACIPCDSCPLILVVVTGSSASSSTLQYA